MKFFSLIFLTLLMVSRLGSQTLSQQKTLKVSGYMLSSVGYPSKIVPLGDEKFAYIEYWTMGEGRKFPAYYLQGYNSQYEEEWFTPLNKQGEANFKATDLIKLKNSLAVTGKLYVPSAKREETYVRFFSLQGKEKGGVLKMSTLDKTAKGIFEDEISISADSSKVLWMGYKPGALGKKKSYYFSVYESDGKLAWGKKLVLPHADGKLKVHQSVVDDKGNLYVLLMNEAPTNSPKDTLTKPWILRYDYRENKFSEYKIDLPGASVPEARIFVTRKGELVFAGILSDESEKGFLNGAKAYPKALKWNKIAFRKFNITRELTLSGESNMEVPEAWLKKYSTNGANFARSEMLEHNGKLLWVLEEYYTQIHNKEPQFLFYDIAVIALDVENGKIDWANSFEKKQRDYNSGRLLSYVAGFSGQKLNFVYLNERGAQGKIMCSSFELETGNVSHKDLVSNFNSDYLFFPKRSGMISKNAMMLMGVGVPNQNEYKLIRIEF